MVLSLHGLAGHAEVELEAVIVDLDGTMVDTLGDFEVALNRMLAQFGLPAVNRAFIERTVGKGSEHLVSKTLEFIENIANVTAKSSYCAIDSIVNSDASQAVKIPTLAQAMDAYQSQYLAANGHHSAVYAGVCEGLDALRARGLKLACLTNKPAAFALPLLKAKGLDGYFHHVFGGDAFARKKPDPLPLLETCRALGTLPAHTLMLGDSCNDALAARAAGCPVVLVTYGYNHGEPIRGVDADGYVDSLLGLFAASTL